MDLETLRVKFEAVGSTQAAAAARSMQDVVTKALGKVNAGLVHTNRNSQQLNRSFKALTRSSTALAASLTMLDGKDIRTKVDVQTLGAGIPEISSLATALTRLGKVGDLQLNIRVDSLIEEILEVERLAAAVRELKDRSVRINVNQSGDRDLDRDSGPSVGAGVSRGFRNVTDEVDDLGRALVITAGKSTLLTTALFTATAATSVLSVAGAGLAGGAIAGALGGLTAGALALGGALGVAGGGVAAFGILAYPAIKGVTDAFKDYTTAVTEGRKAIASGDFEGYDEAFAKQEAALAALSPMQQTVITNLQNLKDVWTATSASLEPTALGVFNSAIATAKGLLPDLLAVAMPVGDALAGVFEKATAGLQGDVFRSFIDAAKSSAGGLVTQFGDIGLNLAAALGAGFTNGLPLISAVMSSLVDNSAQFAQAFQGQGFTDFVSFGVEMLPLLGDLFGSLAGAVGALLTGLQPLAPIAVGVLTSLADSLKAAFSGSGMDEFVSTASAMLPLVGDALRSIGGAAGALLDAVAPLGPVVLQSIGGLGDALKTAFSSDAATTFIANLGQLLPQVVPILGLLADTVLTVGATLTTALLPLLPVLQSGLEVLAPAFTGLVTALAQGLAPILAVAIPLIAQVATVLSSGLQSVLPSLSGSLVELVSNGLGPLVTGLAEFVASGVLPGLIPVFGQLATSVVDLMPSLLELVPAVTGLLTALVPLLPPILMVGGALLETLVPALTTVVGWLTNVAGWLGDHQGLWTGLVTVLGTVFTAFTIAGAVIGPLISVLGFLGSAFGAISTVLGVVAGAVGLTVAPFLAIAAAVAALGYVIYKNWDTISSATTKAIDWIADKLSDAILWINELPNKIIAAVQGFGSVLHDAGANLIRGFTEGLKSAASGPFNAAKEMLEKIRRLFPFSPAKEGPFSGPGWVLNSGISMAKALGDGFTQTLPKLKADMTVGMNAASAALTPALSLGAATASSAATAGASSPLRLELVANVNGYTASSQAPAGSVEELALKVVEGWASKLANGADMTKVGGTV